MSRIKVVLLAGGVGGAKLAEGLYGLRDQVSLSIIGNVADDAEFHGLWVSPDIDTLTYSLTERIDRGNGWGVAGDSLQALSTLRELGADAWMQLGDRDIGLHLYRTERRRRGDRPSDIARDIARALGLDADLLLPTDQVIQTRVRCADGWLGFQEYFVRERCRPEVLELAIAGIDAAAPTPEALAAIAAADLIAIAPSNPLVSIGPILQVPGIRAALQAAPAPCLAVSPLIAGRALKGPAAKMLVAQGYAPGNLGVAACYRALLGDRLDGLLIDTDDGADQRALEAQGTRVWQAPTLMQGPADKVRVAKQILVMAEALAARECTP